jgi:hypothetical protein
MIPKKAALATPQRAETIVCFLRVYAGVAGIAFPVLSDVP